MYTFIALSLIVGTVLGTAAGFWLFNIGRTADAAFRPIAAQLCTSAIFAIISGVATLAITDGHASVWCMLLSPLVLPVVLIGAFRLVCKSK